MSARAFAGAALVSLLVAAPVAAADDAASEKSRRLFDVGKEAYEAGDFPVAITAFESAFKLAPRPGIVFSIAQAHRRQYKKDDRPEHVRDAIKFYRDYLKLVPAGGGRSEEAEQALAELEPIAARLTQAPSAAPKPDVKQPVRLMITTNIKDATFSVDNGKPLPMSLHPEVTPGKHTLRVVANGYFPEEREVQVEAPEGQVVSFDIPLREMPGRLDITGVAGAQVTIDGRLTGALPFPTPLEVSPGAHLVAITKPGYKTFSDEIELNRGQTKPIAVKSALTGQRIFSYVLFGVGVAAVATGSGLAFVAGAEQRKAKDLGDKATKTGGQPASAFTMYDNALKARDRYRGAAAGAVSVGVLSGAIGLLLYVFDQPAVPAPRAKPEDKGKPPAPAPKDTPMEMTAGATLGPGLYGASLVGRF